MAKNIRKVGESLPLARTSLLATPSRGGHPRNAPIDTPIEAPYELPEGWKWCKQNEVCRLTDGEKKTDVSYPYLEVKYLRGNKEKDFVTSGKFIKAGTKVILVDGENSGEVFTVPEDGYMGSTFKALSIQNVDEKYLQFFIQTKKDLYRNNKKGSAIPHLNKDLFFNMPFPLPPTLAEQQRIVNRIETMFAKLDQAQEKAQAVLDSFETRKAAILHKAFTGQLKIDNEELPIEDWEDTTIGECCRLGSGGTPSKSHPEYYENGDIPWLKTGEIDWNDIYDVEERITNEGVENSSAKIFPAESVAVAMYGMGVTRGKAAIIKIPTATNQAVCILQPNEKLNNRFLFYYFMCNYWQIREQSVGGNQLNLSGKIIASFPIKLPPLNYQLSIVNFLDSVLEKETCAKEAVQTVLDQIALLKKSILARAFRGEL